MSRTGAEIVGVTRRKRRPYPDRFQAWVTDPPGSRPRLRTKMFDTRQEAITWRNAQALPLRVDTAFRAAAALLDANDEQHRKSSQDLRESSRKLFGQLQRELQTQALRSIQPPTTTTDLGELWRWIPGQEGKYQISSHGRVWSQPRIRATKTGLLNPLITAKGYRQITFGPRSAKPVKVYRLVLTVFDRPKPPGLVGRHLNGDPADDRIENLRWGTPRENVLDMIWHNECRRNNYPRSMYVRPTTGTGSTADGLGLQGARRQPGPRAGQAGPTRSGRTTTPGDHRA